MFSLDFDSFGFLTLHTFYFFVSEIDALKQDPKYSSILSYYEGEIPNRNKIPFNLREKWVTYASYYKMKHKCRISSNKINVLCSFVRNMSRIRNDPSMHYDTSSSDFANTADAYISRKNEVVYLGQISPTDYMSFAQYKPVIK